MPLTTSSSSLALSSLHLRIEAEEKEHQWLLKQIKRKQTELNNFVEQMRSLATEIFEKGNSTFKKVAALDQEIHALFEEIFCTRKFGKQTKKEIEEIYRNLQMAGIITPTQHPIDEEELDELFEEQKQEENFFCNGQQSYHQHESEAEELAESSENKGRSESARQVRQAFLRLAEIFHPDKVTDSETQVHHTELMKEINKAYQEGDLARLLEIERQHQAGEEIDNNSEDDLTRKYNRLERENEFLKTQYENLKRELRLVKRTPEGAMVSDYRKAIKVGIDPIAQMLSQVEGEVRVISSIRDFVKDFRDKKMTIKEFLQGPEAMHQMGREAVEDLLAEMLADVEEFVIF
ncbi:MAG: J domain-containing protein [Calothrix sp. MO_192.B10]|nr:J domain-containing protein [Calothrix sp. MO_192.B10]